ncbi:hypothetical protein BM536_005425 [Streptomyces phaeoluteigriseus]|uniref:Uncharacterized protein n=1 Tax=Streptomyces phaeoluteigriseus TaxID=114686 RepID=A0A1V6MYL2_9ACTN|nr:hypothetical protein [Streptomyces phaeoluteigriseus]OQD57393.1 hypothetical protein BM536_005425 [Streptomyces phaeoluteigriseus]
MLVVDIGLVNLRFDGRRLVRRDPGAPTLILVGLPPQHVLEEVPAPVSPVVTALDPMKAVTADSTQLAFSVPADIDGLELSLASLLNWARLVPMTVPAGLQSPDTAGSTVFQGIPRSVIEFPTRLLITYDEPVDWVGRREPQQVDGRTALWHTRLHGARDGEVLLRAFATVADRSGLTANNPLTVEKLEDIVTLTSRAELSGPSGSLPIEVPSAPLQAEQFIMTPLGTSAHVRGAWEPLSPESKRRLLDLGKRAPNLETYDHITGLGRDQYIRVVSRGRLSTGHEAQLVSELRRLFVARPNDGIVAYLQREDRVVVKQPEVQYGSETGFTHGGREMPFRALRITDRVTPPLLQPVPGNDAFWVALQSSGGDHEFTLIGTDHENRKVSFTMPLVFVPDGMEKARQETQLKDLYAGDLNATAPSPIDQKLISRMNRSMGGQVMAMAQPPADALGSTSHAVGKLTFGLGVTGPAGHPVVGLPHVSAAEVRVPAVEQFTPNAGYLAVRFNDTFLQQSMEKHPAGAYLNLDQALSLTFGAEKAGGVASPNASVKLITSQAGVIPDVFKTGTAGDVVEALPLADIKAAFGGAKLLGFIDLGRYLQNIAKDSLGTLRQLGDDQIEAILRASNGLLPTPVLRIRDLADGQGKELRYVWKTALGKRDVQPGDNSKDILDVSHAVLTLDARTVRSKDAVDKATVEGRLTNFALDFEGMARVEIADLQFRTGPGKKPEVAASGLELKFTNELEFINSLRSALPADAFGGGAYIEVQPSGIRAGYRLALPAIGVGVFTLSNVSLGAELLIPFDGKPVSFRFTVSERTHPFNVTVSLFGGGGYFSMLVDATGVQQIEGAIEFGGSAALNLGVASGGVSVMAGIRFEFDGAADRVSLGGYLRCNGFLCVLGIITVSVEFYLELTYEKHGRESVVRGKGRLTVSVRIAFFSKSVSLELERSFSGAPGDPTFADSVLPHHWHEYCPAFAP